MIDIITAIRNNEDIDHVGFLENCNIKKPNYENNSTSIFSIKFKKWETNDDFNIRCANPKSVIKKSKALEIGFEDIRFSEDIIFSEKITEILEKEIFIDKELYFYRYDWTEHNERYGI